MEDTDKEKPEVGTILYRVEEQVGGGLMESLTVRYMVREYEVLKHTNKGIWLKPKYGKKRWRKWPTTYAVEDKEEALKRYWYRKLAHVEHACRRARYALESFRELSRMTGRAKPAIRNLVDINRGISRYTEVLLSREFEEIPGIDEDEALPEDVDLKDWLVQL